MAPVRYWAPAIAPRALRIRLTASWPRAVASWARSASPRSRATRSPASLYRSVARSASP